MTSHDLRCASPQVVEISQRPLRPAMLRSREAFLLVADSELWVWVGRRASKGEKQKAMLYAQSFLQGKQLPAHTPVTRVVEGAEPPRFASHFAAWPAPHVAAAAADEFGAAASARLFKDAAEAAVRGAPAALLPTGEGSGGELVAWRLEPTGGGVGGVGGGASLSRIPQAEVGQFSASHSYVLRYSWGGADAAGDRQHALYAWHGARSAATAERGVLETAAASRAAEEQARPRSNRAPLRSAEVPLLFFPPAAPLSPRRVRRGSCCACGRRSGPSV